MPPPAKPEHPCVSRASRRSGCAGPWHVLILIPFLGFGVIPGAVSNIRCPCVPSIAVNQLRQLIGVQGRRILCCGRSA